MLKQRSQGRTTIVNTTEDEVIYLKIWTVRHLTKIWETYEEAFTIFNIQRWPYVFWKFVEGWVTVQLEICFRSTLFKSSQTADYKQQLISTNVCISDLDERDQISLANDLELGLGSISSSVTEERLRFGPQNVPDTCFVFIITKHIYIYMFSILIWLRTEQEHKSVNHEIHVSKRIL